MMTTPDSGTDVAMPPIVTCSRCGDDVPDGAFCGACGAHLYELETHGNLRSHAFALAPGEHLLQPSFVSTLFPQLPHRARAPFRIGAAVLLVALIVLGALRLQAPIVAVAALGVPLLFLVYLYEIDVYEDYHWAEALAVLGGGAAIGFLWAHFTGSIVTHAVTRHLGESLVHRDLVVAGIVIPAAAQLLMLVPAMVIWLRRQHRTEAMDGFVVGAAGALGFVAASTLTRLWPQLSSGVRASNRSAGSVLGEGLLQGVTVPLVAACASALVAATFWVVRRDAVHGGRLAASPFVALVLALGLQVGLGIADLWQPDLSTLVALHAAAAVVLLVALRVAMHFVVLHEQHEVVVGPPHVCAHCHHVVPLMPFCPHCGFAQRGTTRKLRDALTLTGASQEGSAS
jgi:RsiW-degrading membrane proteinase PrsW (M82 family)